MVNSEPRLPRLTRRQLERRMPRPNSRNTIGARAELAQDLPRVDPGRMTVREGNAHRVGSDLFDLRDRGVLHRHEGPCPLAVPLAMSARAEAPQIPQPVDAIVTILPVDVQLPGF